MKILHTSDWHLGRQFHGISLEMDHAAVLEQVMDALAAHDPDVLVIAGDIFDRAAPPAFAVRQFNDFIARVHANTRAAIVLIAGNHDSGDRIDSLSVLAARQRVLIRGPLGHDEPPLILSDEHGQVAISALPYGTEYAASECFGDPSISCPADVIKAQVAAARGHVPDGARWVIVAHAFISNATKSDSERNLIVGGIETVPPEAFADADYVALGHLHRPQRAGADHIRYSGSPLAFGFDEADAEKSMTLITLGADGVTSLECLPFSPKRKVRVLTGAFAQLMADAQNTPSEDFVKLVLTDAGAILDAVGQIRPHYPNTLALAYARDAVDGEQPGATLAARHTDPVAVVEEFFAAVRPDPPLTESEKQVVVRALGELQHAEAAA
jgi:exonuclease SbcD